MESRDVLLQWFLGLLLGAVGGAGGTFVMLRTTLAGLARDIEDEREKRKGRAEIVDARLDQMDRRQVAALRVITDIARHVGVDQRKFDDALIQMLGD